MNHYRILRLRREQPLTLKVMEPSQAFLEEAISEQSEQRLPPDVLYMLKSIRLVIFVSHYCWIEFDSLIFLSFYLIFIQKLGLNWKIIFFLVVYMCFQKLYKPLLSVLFFFFKSLKCWVIFLCYNIDECFSGCLLLKNYLWCFYPIDLISHLLPPFFLLCVCDFFFKAI